MNSLLQWDKCERRIFTWGRASIDPKIERNLKKHPSRLITWSSFNEHSHHTINAAFSKLFSVRREEKQANERELKEYELFTVWRRYEINGSEGCRRFIVIGYIVTAVKYFTWSVCPRFSLHRNFFWIKFHNKLRWSLSFCRLEHTSFPNALGDSFKFNSCSN